MSKWLIGRNEAIREKDIHSIKIERQDKDVYMSIAYDSQGEQLSILACEVGKDKFYKYLNKLLNGENNGNK